jgi:hypothetical protein
MPLPGEHQEQQGQQGPSQLKSALYLQPRSGAPIFTPKAAKKYAQASAAAAMVSPSQTLYIYLAIVGISVARAGSVETQGLVKGGVAPLPRALVTPFSWA